MRYIITIIMLASIAMFAARIALSAQSSSDTLTRTTGGGYSFAADLDNNPQTQRAIGYYIEHHCSVPGNSIVCH